MSKCPQDIEDTPQHKVPSCFNPGELTLDLLEDFLNVKERIPHNFIKDQEYMERLVKNLCHPDCDISSRKKADAEKQIQARSISKGQVGTPNSSNLLYTYRSLIERGEIKQNLDFEKNYRGKRNRTTDGVSSFTGFTSPFPQISTYPASEYYKLWQEESVEQKFSCQFDCGFCPNDPKHVRSYTPGEPGYDRALRNKFCPIRQFRDRAVTFRLNGLIVDKIEYLILGGTWHSYPADYREWFIACIYYAANTLYDQDFRNNPRDMLSMQEEIKINETARARIIGMTVETRPDQITPKTIIEFRRQGITRVQMGVQHTDDIILNRINRQCPTQTTLNAAKMLTDSCFKFDIHLMPDLPGSSVKKDRKMFYFVLQTPFLQADQQKIYPTQCIPHTRIYDMYHAGEYQPYAETMVRWEDYCTERTMQLKELKQEFKEAYGIKLEEGPFSFTVHNPDDMVNPLYELLVEYKAMVHPWIRLNRVTRDIPTNLMVNLEKIQGIGAFTNMRQFLQKTLKDREMTCDCMRCREVRGLDTDLSKAEIVVREYDASDGKEYFISFELLCEKTGNIILYGFLRLRLSPMAGLAYKRVGRKAVVGSKGTEIVFPELNSAALIRELHVYGDVTAVDTKEKMYSQHFGFGSKLLARAEQIAIDNGYEKIGVISGVGVREYYRKKGYKDGEYFLIKNLVNVPQTKQNYFCFFLLAILYTILALWFFGLLE